jgi:hypothetical protein
MGLYGSEFHTFSFHTRAGVVRSKRLLKEMLPLSPEGAREIGIVDYVFPASKLELETEELIEKLMKGEKFKLAPWCGGKVEGREVSIEEGIKNKKNFWRGLKGPMRDYREAELREMKEDFWGERSERYHSRRVNFVRKIAGDSTPIRFAKHRRWDWTKGEMRFDEEETESFDLPGPSPLEEVQSSPDLTSSELASSSRRGTSSTLNEDHSPLTSEGENEKIKFPIKIEYVSDSSIQEKDSPELNRLDQKTPNQRKKSISNVVKSMFTPKKMTEPLPDVPNSAPSFGVNSLTVGKVKRGGVLSSLSLSPKKRVNTVSQKFEDLEIQDVKGGEGTMFTCYNSFQPQDQSKK